MSPVPPRTVSVLVPTHDRDALLRTTLEAVLSDGGATEVVVVDDASRDATPHLLHWMARDEPRLRVVRNDRNRGKAMSLTIGATRATGDVLLLLDDDVLAGPGLASGHLRVHASRPGPLVVVGTMPVVLPPRRRPGQAATWRYAREYEQMTDRYERDPSEILRNLWGGNVSVPRELFLQVPALDLPTFDDKALGAHLAHLGCTAVHDPDLTASHLHVRPLPAFRRDARRYGAVEPRFEHDPVIPPIDADASARVFLERHPSTSRVLERPSAARAAADAAAVVTRVAGLTHWWWGEEAALRALRRVEQARGYLEVVRSVGAVGPGPQSSSTKVRREAGTGTERAGS